MTAEDRLAERLVALLGHPDPVDAPTHALLVAIRTTPKDPREWSTETIVAALRWADQSGEEITRQVPTLIRELGIRPADAVALLIRYALCYGIEIGRNWP